MSRIFWWWIVVKSNKLLSFPLFWSVSYRDYENYELCSRYPKAFYIEIAAHMDVLLRNINNQNEKILTFAQKTREILIPQVKYMIGLSTLKLRKLLIVWLSILNQKIKGDYIHGNYYLSSPICHEQAGQSQILCKGQLWCK